MHNDKELIGKKIKEFRKKNKFSQAELAELVGLSDKHIGRIEAGYYFPSVNNFLNIMHVLKMNFSDFGFDLNYEEAPEKAELLRLIASSNEEEIKLYLQIFKLIKKSKV